MKTYSKDEMNNLASATAVIAFHLGYHKRKIGREGIMLHYELIQQIAEKFCEKYPHDYNWEDHRENGGEDWDVVCEKFADEIIANDFDFRADDSYYN